MKASAIILSVESFCTWEQKMYYSLNETGLRIWQLLNDGLTLNEISERLQDEFDVTHEKARESVFNLINELITEKLVEVVDE